MLVYLQIIFMQINAQPADGGMLYTETNLNHILPEPLNMLSAALFLIPAIYWLIKIKAFSRHHIFLSLAAWLLLIASIGGTAYHGLRRWRIFIFMDWLPIALLCLMASVYFWYKLSGKWHSGLLALTVFAAVVSGVRLLLPFHNLQLAISLNYGVMVLMVVLPLTLLLIRMRGHNLLLVILSLFSFSVALFFRIADSWDLLNSGTHFLWHVFGCIATSLIFIFIYRLNDYR